MFNIYDNSGKKNGVELTEELVKLSENVRVERIISMGEVTPEGFWYDQEEDEFVCLVSGSARLEFKKRCENDRDLEKFKEINGLNSENYELEMNKGDCLLIPRHIVHRVSYTAVDNECIWLCVFVG